MKIAYLGNWNKYSHSTEKLVKYSLEKLGHKVIPIDERDFTIKDILDVKADLFLFHKGTRWGKDISFMVNLLSQVTCKKAFWYFDPITNIQEREFWMDAIIPYVDLGFMTNETWIRRHNYSNLRTLRQACGDEDNSLGKEKDGYKVDVAFTGSIYGDREKFVDGLESVYKDKFRIFNNVFGKDFKDLCASAKILVAPRFPNDDFFWSNRIYMTLGNGGFLIHPKFEGLKEEYEEGVHYVGYSTGRELKEKIDYYLTHDKERKKIQKAGYEHTIKNFNYTKRCQSLIEQLQKEQ